MADQTQGAGGEAAATTTEGALLDEILSETRLTPTDDGYDVTRNGIKALMKELLSPKHQNEKVDKAFADALIAEIDEKITKQVDVILHHPAFQKLEGSWRGLKYLLDQSETGERLKIKVLNVNKKELLRDLQRAPEFDQSALFKKVYEEEFGVFGGAPSFAFGK